VSGPREARPGAFHGELVDVAFDWKRGHFVGHVSVPLPKLDPFFKEVGTPPHPDDREAPGKRTPVVLLACYGQTAEIADDEVIAAAALDALIRLADQGRLQVNGRLSLAGRIQRFADACARAAGICLPAGERL
jgi:hypothetical protein